MLSKKFAKNNGKNKNNPIAKRTDKTDNRKSCILYNIKGGGGLTVYAGRNS